MAAWTQSEILRLLKAARRAELAHLRRHHQALQWSACEVDHAASTTVVLPDAESVMARIDAAEERMRSVLRGWQEDPTRGGAHLLVDTATDPALPQTVIADDWPPVIDEDAPTTRPA